MFMYSQQKVQFVEECGATKIFVVVIIKSILELISLKSVSSVNPIVPRVSFPPDLSTLSETCSVTID